MGDSSFLKVISSLCDLNTGTTKRAFQVQPLISRPVAKKRLKLCAYNALFSYLKDNPVEDDLINQKAVGIPLEVFELREQKQLQEADKLENLFNKLKERDNFDDLNQVLRLMIALKNTANSINKENQALEVFRYQNPKRYKNEYLKSEVPFVYGDPRLDEGFSHYYTHFPSDVFSQPFPSIFSNEEEDYNKIFNNLPGEFLNNEQTFTKKSFTSPHEQSTHSSRTHSTLFGGLTESRTSSLHVMLDLPELASAPELRIPEFQCRKSISSSHLSEESGLGSGGASMSTSITSSIMADTHQATPTAGYDTSIWETCLTEPQSQNYTWEWRGYQPGLTEKPYLSETGPAVFDLVIRLRHRVCSLVLHTPVSHFLTVDTPHLVKYITLMLNGVPSVFFPYDDISQRFSVAPGLHVVGVSPDVLQNFLSDFVDHGSLYVRLVHFSKPPVLNSFYHGGLIFQAFVLSMRKVLKYMTSAVLNVPSNLPLLQLKVYFHKAMGQCRYLATLCGCFDNPTPKQLPGDFPTGMRLISFLYRETLTAISSPHYPLLLSLLQASCAPFMMFIRDWAFHGVFTDSFREFMVYADHQCIDARDESYWERAYTMMSGEHDRGDIPQFLQEVAADIVTCGKSINLLRLCSPRHFMCNLSESELPSVGMTLSQSELRASERYCQSYTGKMREVARRITVDRKYRLEQIEQSKLELQQTAKRIADKEIARLQGIIDNNKKKENAKKKIEFDRLKLQMEKDLKRRAGEVYEEKEEDKLFIARLNREEDALTEQEIELEKKTRDDLVAYYTELGEDAMQRERVALWRVRRAQLGGAREAFMREEEERWRREMEELATGELVLDSVQSTSLPKWAEKASKSDTTLEVEETDEEVPLPAWATRELNSLGSNEESGGVTREVREDEGGDELDEHEEGDELDEQEEEKGVPNWVERAMGDTGMDPLEIEDEAGLESDVGANNKLSEHDTEMNSSQNLDRSIREYRAVQIGGASLPRAQVKTSSKMHSTVETAESESKPHIHTVAGQHISDQTEEKSESKPHTKAVGNMNILGESQQVVERAHVKTSATMSASTQSEDTSDYQKLHLKFREGVQVNQQTTEEHHMIPRRVIGQGLHSISAESESQEWHIKKPSLFGHSSQLSNSHFDVAAPRMRRNSRQHANIESSYKDFSIKPRVRMNSKMSASKQSDETPSGPARSTIRINTERNSGTQSVQVDEHAVAIERFKRINMKGHASDSSVQKLLYWDNNKSLIEEIGPLPRIEIKQGLPHSPEMYQTDEFDFDTDPSVDLMSNIMTFDLGRGLIEESVPSEEDVEVYKYTPLSVLLAKSLTTPVRAQISLVNTAVINYFTSELKVDDHFVAIRRYLLMADGDFAEILSNILLEKLASNPLPQEILNSVFLTSALSKAKGSSIHANDELLHNLSFAVKYMPNVLKPNEPSSLKCLQLQYNIPWPLNIILTSACMEKYHQVFSFLLQIKRMVWVLKDVWYRLKREVLINKVGKSSEFRHLQFHRQEMEHFVSMLQGYISHQVIHVSWQEFQTQLKQPIDGIDQLQQMHTAYVNKAIARCLLNKKAEKVMKYIQDIFCLILKFRSQLVSGTWQPCDTEQEVTHTNFAAMQATYKSFHQYSFFLFKVVSRLSLKGYQPHLQELLLQLNFNDYYTQVAN